MNAVQRMTATRRILRAMRRLALAADAVTMADEKEALAALASAEVWARSARDVIRRVPAKKRETYESVRARGRAHAKKKAA